MSYILSSFATTSKDVTATIENNPEFRRATLNMKLAHIAGEKALEFLPKSANRAEIALIVGTSFGELQSTYDFFCGINLENVARPLAFQNSLHHSTLGFLSRSLGITGAGFSISDEYFSGEQALELGKFWTLNRVEYALVIGVDVIPKVLRAPAKARAGCEIEGGAGAILLARRPLPGVQFRIERIELGVQPPFKEPLVYHYDSDAIALVAQNLKAGVLCLSKPSGCASRIQLVEA